jgi:putative radical SAM enzyme (TIGR03279 family)
LRDDDYRLSFLQGNFVTLTNVTEDDVERISEQHLSPLYVSLHAVDPDVRRDLVCARDDHALERLDELLASSIDVHVQIVLVPGVNDGEVLDQTLGWLAERDGVASVGVVPLGYTGHQSRFARSYNDPEAAAQVIAQVAQWQTAMRQRDGVTWVHLADEFYLNAAQPAPPAEHYDGFPQYENGIGLLRSIEDESAALGFELGRALEAVTEAGGRVTVLTGTLAASTLTRLIGAHGPAGAVRVLGVPNVFFGGNVSVAGLLTANDLVAAIGADGARGIYLLPDVALNADGLTLDDSTLEEVRRRSGGDVRLVSSDAAGLVAGIEDAAADLAQD